LELGLEISLGLEAAIRLVVAIVETLGGGLGRGKGESESENLSFGEHYDSESIRRRIKEMGVQRRSGWVADDGGQTATAFEGRRPDRKREPGGD
jgi:hypothetical protein